MRYREPTPTTDRGIICANLDEKVPSTKSYKELITLLENGLGWKAQKVNYLVGETSLGYCKEREATLVYENFDSGIIKTIEWYLNKYKGKK